MIDFLQVNKESDEENSARSTCHALNRTLAQLFLNSFTYVTERAQERDFMRFGHRYFVFSDSEEQTSGNLDQISWDFMNDFWKYEGQKY